jgi:RES domain-containing protein
MLAYRIRHRNFSQQLFASGAEGRWNSAGKKVIYAAESITLAFLENMVRRQGVGFNSDFKIMVIEIPKDSSITMIPATALKMGWRDFKDYSACQLLGDEWYNQGVTPVLKVPSAVLSDSFNYVIHTGHNDYTSGKIKHIATTDLVPDERIEDLLKKYPKK